MSITVPGFLQEIIDKLPKIRPILIDNFKDDRLWDVVGGEGAFGAINGSGLRLHGTGDGAVVTKNKYPPPARMRVIFKKPTGAAGSIVLFFNVREMTSPTSGSFQAFYITAIPSVVYGEASGGIIRWTNTKGANPFPPDIDWSSEHEIIVQNILGFASLRFDGLNVASHRTKFTAPSTSKYGLATYNYQTVDFLSIRAL